MRENKSPASMITVIIEQLSPTESDRNCTYLVTVNTTYHVGIHHPGFPEKPANNLNCEWVLQSPSPHERVFLRLFFDLEESSSCIYDRIHVYDGEFMYEADDLRNSDMWIHYIKNNSLQVFSLSCTFYASNQSFMALRTSQHCRGSAKKTVIDGNRPLR